MSKNRVFFSLVWAAAGAFLTASATASPFINPFPGAAGDGSYDPGYDPSFSLYFGGSLYTIDTDGDGVGAEGVIVFGDRNMTSLLGNPIHPGTSLRAFNVRAANGQPDGETAAPIVNNDPFPSWGPDTPDADPGWVAAYSGSERYGLDMALGAGKFLSPLGLVGPDWAVTLYPWAPGAGAGAVVQPFSGTVDSFGATFAGDGTGGVTDTMTTTTLLGESDGNWNIDFNDDGTDDEVFQLEFDKFLARSTLYEVGNSFTISAPVGGGTWTLNEWSSINPDTGVQGFNPITPVPAPAAAVLAVIGLGAARRLRRRSGSA